MPAPSYLITAQLGLVAASVIFMQVDWQATKPPTKPVPPPKAPLAPALAKGKPATAPVPKAVPFNPATDTPPAPPVPESLPPDEVPPPLPKTAPWADEIETKPMGADGYNIAADAASKFDIKTQTVVFNGHVSLKSKRFDLRSSKLIIYMDPKTSTLKRMVATGDVNVQMKPEDPKAEVYTGTSAQAIYVPKDNAITMTGWPRIQTAVREHRALEATTVMVLHTDPSHLTTEGRANTKLIGNINRTSEPAPKARQK